MSTSKERTRLNVHGKYDINYKMKLKKLTVDRVADHEPYEHNAQMTHHLYMIWKESIELRDTAHVYEAGLIKHRNIIRREMSDWSMVVYHE